MKKKTYSKKPQYKQGEKLGTVEKIQSKHEEIAQRIIDSLEANVIPWKKPWTALPAQNLFSRKEYRGINQMLLSLIPTKYPFFFTFQQAKEHGGHIIKGSKSIPVYFYKPLTYLDNKQPIKEDGSANEKSWFMMKQFQVFTIEQCEGIQVEQFIDPVIDFEPVLKAENLVKAWLESQKMEVLGAQGAAYSPSKDYLLMPAENMFHSVDAYYSTMFHEMIHSTGHSSRLNRDGFNPETYHTRKSKGYAFEELIAEFGAAMLASYCGVDTSLEEGQSTAYIKGWLEVFKADPQIAYKAASKAQAAVDFILNATGFNAFGEEETETEQKIGA